METISEELKREFFEFDVQFSATIAKWQNHKVSRDHQTTISTR